MVTVRAHTAKYDAADKAKEMATKKGAGKELENRKKKNEEVQLEIPFDKEEEKKVLDKVKGEEKKPTSKKSEKPAEKKTTKKVRPVGSGTNGPTPKEKSVVKSTATSSVKRDPTDVEFLARQIAGARSGSLDAARDKVNSMSDRTYKSWLRSYGVLKDKKSSMKSKPTTSTPAFTAAEFKEWYRGTGSAADKKVAKALRAQLGRAGYRKLEDEAIDNYSSRGHLSMYKSLGGVGSAKSDSKTGKQSPRGTTTKGFNAALEKVKATGARKTQDIKDGLARLGYDYDTGKKYGRSQWHDSSGNLKFPSNPKFVGGDKKGGRIYSTINVGGTFLYPSKDRNMPASDIEAMARADAKTLAKYGYKNVRVGRNRNGDVVVKSSAPDYSGDTAMFKRVSGGTDKASTTGKRVKMPDKVREKKRKHEEYLRKVKESGMSIDEYNRLH